MEDEEFREMVERTASQLKRNEISILANKLGISEFDIQDISLKYGGNFWCQKVEILYRWRTTYREYATKERLCRVMNEIKGSSYRSMDGTNDKGDTKNKKKSDQRSDSAKVPLRRERAFRSVHLRGSAIQMSPRWRHDKRQHSIDTMIKSDGHSSRESPSTIPTDFQSGYHVTRELDLSSEEEAPSSSCVFRGGKLRIQIHLPSGGFTTFDTQENNRTDDARKLTDRSSVAAPWSGNESSSIFPAISHKVPIGTEVIKAGNVKEENDLGERLIVEKGGGLLIDEEIKKMRLEPELVQCEAENPYVKCTVDSLEAFDGVFVDKVKFKCILLTCRVVGIDSLDKIWEESRGGTLREKILKALSSLIRGASRPGTVPWEGIRVIIPQDEYIHCRKQLIERRLLGDNSYDEISEDRTLKSERRISKNHPRMEPLNQSLRPLESDQDRAMCKVKSHWRVDEVIAGWEPMSSNACC